MRMAVSALQNGRSLGEAATAYDVPKATLSRKVQLARNAPGNEYIQFKTPLGRKPVLSSQLEDELVKYLVLMDEMFFGLTRDVIRRLACQLTHANGIETPFTDDKAGRDWFERFLKRHPQLAIRKAENTSLARAKGFNKQSVETFISS